MTTLANKYDAAQLNYQSKDGIKLMEKLSPEKGSFVLDLGCGTGFLASILAARVGTNGKVYGVDPSAERIKVAIRKYASIDNLEFFIGSSENFPNGPYDAVFSNHVLHWIEDKESTFQKVFNNLNINGKFAILCGAEHITKHWEIFKQPGTSSQYLCTSDELKKLASNCGFEVEFELVEPLTYTFESAEICADWVLTNLEIHRDTVDPVKIEEFKKQCGPEPHLKFIIIMIVLRKVYAEMQY